MTSYSEIPDHVRRIIEREGEVRFTPPSFERWIGRLHMLRTVASMAAFLLVFMVAYDHGMAWETATVRALVAGIVFNFFAWAAGLYLFGELYDAEVKQARRALEEKERERARRIEQYYRDRLQEQEAPEAGTVPGGVVPSLGQPTPAGPSSMTDATYRGEQQRYAA
jgi:hypothetical protein